MDTTAGTTAARAATAERPSSRRRSPTWALLSLPVALLIAAPVAAVLAAALAPAGDVCRHILATTLPEMLGNSLALVAMVGAMTATSGAVSAWPVTPSRLPPHRA